MLKKVDKQDIDKVLAFSLELKAQDAKMSFTSYDTIDQLEMALEDENCFLYIKVEDDQVIAMFRAIRGSGNKSHSCYVACAVKSSHRKQNLATEVTHYGLADMKTQGVLIARTKIYSWNKASIATIKKCGFEESGRVYMHQYESDLNAYIDDLIFHKVL